MAYFRYNKSFKDPAFCGVGKILSSVAIFFLIIEFPLALRMINIFHIHEYFLQFANSLPTLLKTI